MSRRRQRGEDGQLLLLIGVYTVIALVLVLVTVDVSIVFLAQRALSAAADGAAVTAAQALDEGLVYRGEPVDRLPLSSTGVRQAVAGYVQDDGLDVRYPQLDWAAGTDGTGTATVTMRRPVSLPFLGWSRLVTDRYPNGAVTVSVSARARAPLRG